MKHVRESGKNTPLLSSHHNAPSKYWGCFTESLIAFMDEICYGVKHNAWDTAYAGDELANWLLSHKKTR